MKKTSTVVMRFLHMCPSPSGTAEALFAVIDGKLSEMLKVPNPSEMCISLGLDNTFVNIGIQNSIKSRVLQKNDHIYVNGCPCHIIHNCCTERTDIQCLFWI